MARTILAENEVRDFNIKKFMINEGLTKTSNVQRLQTENRILRKHVTLLECKRKGMLNEWMEALEDIIKENPEWNRLVQSGLSKETVDNMSYIASRSGAGHDAISYAVNTELFPYCIWNDEHDGTFSENPEYYKRDIIDSDWSGKNGNHGPDSTLIDSIADGIAKFARALNYAGLDKVIWRELDGENDFPAERRFR